jgi:general secretion pathway protein H
MILQADRFTPESALRHKPTDAGFTLIEVVVTLAILGFALVLISGYRAPWSSRLGLRGTAAELAVGLRLARSDAIAHNRPVAFKLDLKAHQYQIGEAAHRPLPVELAIELLTVSPGRTSETAANIRFNPDGSSTGGRIVVADRTHRIAIGVDWLSGRVSVSDGR